MKITLRDYIWVLFILEYISLLKLRLKFNLNSLTCGFLVKSYINNHVYWVQFFENLISVS